jgi:hypothetical protein
MGRGEPGDDDLVNARDFGERGVPGLERIGPIRQLKRDRDRLRP